MKHHHLTPIFNLKSKSEAKMKSDRNLKFHFLQYIYNFIDNDFTDSIPDYSHTNKKT